MLGQQRESGAVAGESEGRMSNFPKPKYEMGQSVWFEVEAKAGDIKVSKWMEFRIVGIRMSSDTESITYDYVLSLDTPGPWHAGTVSFNGIDERKLKADKPADAA
jgi:hypothetical protein